MAKLETCGEKGLAQQGSKDALLEGLEDFLRENAERRLCMAAVDVEHFKLDEAGCKLGAVQSLHAGKAQAAPAVAH